MTEYGFAVRVDDGYDEAVTRTRLALRGEGFSILTEAHVGEMLGPEAGAERQYLFMGAYDAALKEPALDGSVEVAVHLPCNFVVQETGSSAIVAALDPREETDPSRDEHQDATDSALQALQRVLEKVAVG
jgi:uncharacterized protein (DUF302 family)